MKQNHIEQLRSMVDNPPIRWMSMANISGEIVEERRVRFVMPVEGLHLNHVNIAYAGSIYALAEMGGGAMFQATYGFDRFVPIIKGSSIKYLKPTNKDLVVELSMTEEEAAEKIRPVEEKGRGDYFLTVPVRDADGLEVAVAEMNYYVLPFTRDLLKGN